MRSIVGKILILVALAIFVLVWGAMVVAAFQYDGLPLNTLDPQGPFAQMIDDLVAPVFVIAGLVFVGVLGAVTFIAIRYRDRGDEDPDVAPMPKQTHGHTPAELTWTAIPALILAVVAVMTAITVMDLAAEEDDALEVEVVGAQWWWQFRYDVNGDGQFDGTEDVETATELVVPAGRPVQLTMTSYDVIHSFWIPALSGKRDVVPGMTTDWKIQADEPGVYRGQCTEFCGLSHANMRMLVRAVSPEEFDDWIAHQQQPAPEPTTDLEQEGLEIFEAQCAQCHLIDGVNNEQIEEGEVPLVTGLAPDLTHLMSRGTFAGGIFNLHYPNPEGDDRPFGATCTMEDLENCGDPTDVGLAGNPDNPVYRPAIEAWLRDAPAMKPMAPDEGRGMPALGLTPDQIDALMAYLETLQ